MGKAGNRNGKPETETVSSKLNGINISKSYTGYVYDETTGYWNAGARMYNSTDREFIQKDPKAGNITEPMTQNGYTYCGDNPLYYIDPDGCSYISTLGNAGRTAFDVVKSGAVSGLGLYARVCCEIDNMPTWAKAAIGTTGIIIAGASGVGAAAIAETVIASAGISAATDGAFYTVASLRNGSFSRSELKDTVINGATNGYMFAGAGLGVAGIRNAAKSGKLAGFMADEAGSVSYEGGRKTKLNYVTSNGLVLETTPNKTTTVLGTYKSDTGAILDELGNVKSLNFGPRDGGFNLLNTPDELYVSPSQFWNEYNKPWLDNAIARTDIFKIATEPTWDNLTRVNMFTGKTELTGFGREYTYLKKCGYYFDTVTKTMVK